MSWFGRRPWAPICEPDAHVATPTGAPCAHCGEPIAADDDGVVLPHFGDTLTERPYHYECQLRAIVGGVNHQRGRCTCCGGVLPPDPRGMSAREAARAAVREWERRRR